MTVEQYKILRRSQQEKRQDALRLYKKAKQHVLAVAREANDQEMLKATENWKYQYEGLKLPRTSFTKKIQSAFEDLILNDVAATEGGCCHSCSIDVVDELKTEMLEVTKHEPQSFCYFTEQDISGIKNGLLNLSWEGDEKLIKNILENHGLNVTEDDEFSELLVREK